MHEFEASLVCMVTVRLARAPWSDPTWNKTTELANRMVEEQNLQGALRQWLSAFPALWPFGTVPHLGVAPNHTVVFITTS